MDRFLTSASITFTFVKTPPLSFDLGLSFIASSFDRLPHIAVHLLVIPQPSRFPGIGLLRINLLRPLRIVLLRFDYFLVPVLVRRPSLFKL